MTALPVPATDEAAIALLERRAALGAELATIEANRAAAIAAINAVGDTLALPIITEQGLIDAVLERWWKKAAPRLTKGKRKSIELGGCVIGTKTGRSALAIAGDEVACLTEMLEHRWAKPYVRVTRSIDRTAVYAGLDGKHAEGLTLLGFSRQPGATTFYVTPIASGAGETVAR